MQKILDRSQQKLPAQRCNSLEILEEIHRYRHQLKEPFTSFELLLGGNPGGFTYQAFLIISGALDTFVSFDSKSTKTQRQKLVGRLKLLLKDGAAEAFRTHSPSLHLAVLLDRKDTLERLLDQGQNPDEPWPKSGWTALHLAAQENKKDFVDALLKANTKANAKDKFGFTPLHYASNGGHSEIGYLLLKRSRVVLSNMAYDQAIQLNAPIGAEEWLRSSHLTIRNIRASGNSIQVNHFIQADALRQLLEARDMARK
jgi:ankyrin repeat protein